MAGLNLKCLLLLLVSFACLLSVVSGDEDVHVEDSSDDTEDTYDALIPEGSIYESINAGDHIRRHPAVSTSVIFTSSENRTQFLAGEMVRVLVGVKSKSRETTFTLKTLVASLRLQDRWEFRIQNFTARPLDTVLSPLNEANFEYVFVPHETLDPRDFGMTLLMGLTDESGAQFQHDLYNGTFTIYEPEQLIDFQTILMLAITGGFVALVAYGMKNALGSQQGKRKVRGAPKPAKKPVTTADSSWLEGTNTKVKKN
eukprot:CFRG6876T1